MTFLLATPVLIGLLIIFIILISAMVEMENSGWATTFFSLSIALLFWHYWSDIWGWVSQNPFDTFIFTGGYIIAGIIWSIIKWKSYISRSARHFEYLKTKFTTEIGQIGANWIRWIAWLDKDSHKLNNAHFYERDEPEDIVRKLTINANEKKPVIVSWIAYWPMSIAATLLNDPIRRLMSYIYDRISGLFQRMSNNSAKNLSKGMDKYGPEHQDSK
jgi:hypothetical protein